jgi:hypothetical protein
LVEILIVVILPAALIGFCPSVLCRCFEQITNAIVASIGTFDAWRCHCDFVISHLRLPDYVPASGCGSCIAKNVMGMIV